MSDLYVHSDVILNTAGQQFNAAHMMRLIRRDDYSDLRARAIRELINNDVDRNEVTIMLMVDILTRQPQGVGCVLSDSRVRFHAVSLRK